MNKLIDSDIFIDFLRGYQGAIDFFLDLWNGEDEIYSSVITEAELLSGKSCNNPEVRTKTEDIINTTIKVNVNSNIAKRAGKYRRMYDISLSDALIASTAKEIGAKLYTRNVKHLKKIEDIEVVVPY